MGYIGLVFDRATTQLTVHLNSRFKLGRPNLVPDFNNPILNELYWFNFYYTNFITLPYIVVHLIFYAAYWSVLLYSLIKMYLSIRYFHVVEILLAFIYL